MVEGLEVPSIPNAGGNLIDCGFEPVRSASTMIVVPSERDNSCYFKS